MKNRFLTLLACAALLAVPLAAKKKPTKPAENPLDRYVAESEARLAEKPAATPGAIWQAGSRLADAARDVRASQVDDILTVVVAAAGYAGSGDRRHQNFAGASSTANSINALAGAEEGHRLTCQPGEYLRGYRDDCRTGHHQPDHHSHHHSQRARHPRASQRRPGGGSV